MLHLVPLIVLLLKEAKVSYFIDQENFYLLTDDSKPHKLWRPPVVVCLNSPYTAGSNPAATESSLGPLS